MQVHCFGKIVSALLIPALMLGVMAGRSVGVPLEVEDADANPSKADEEAGPTKPAGTSSGTTPTTKPAAGNLGPDTAKDAGKNLEIDAAGAQKKLPVDAALQTLDPRTYRLKIIHRVDAIDGAVENVVVLGPIPIDWPEQKVRLISEKMTEDGKSSETQLKGQAAILKFQVPSIPKGGTASIERLYELTRYRTQFSLPPEDLKYTRMAPREMREQLAGPAPGLDTKHPKMVELHGSLKAEDARPWDNIRGFWGWTRDNVKFENGDYRGALFAIEQRCGDCEEMSALFVSLCRLSNIPARTVWVEGHDYPEFYLVDKKGLGHWIPAQVVGPPWFGEITDYRPIFQKGDRFYDPFNKQYVRYIPHTVKGDGPAPKLTVKHEIIADSDINGPAYTNPR